MGPGPVVGEGGSVGAGGGVTTDGDETGEVRWGCTVGLSSVGRYRRVPNTLFWGFDVPWTGDGRIDWSRGR